MHELGIVFNILNSVEEIAKENNVTHIDTIVLEIGEVSSIVNSYLEDCFKWAVEKKDITKGCKLQINTIKAINVCEDCNKEYSAVEHGKICPFCGSEHTHIVQGTEVNIKEIAVH